MIRNALNEKWQAGQGTINGWLSIGNGFVAEIMGEAGYDSLTIDVQHGFLDYGDAKEMFQALRGSGLPVLARVPWNDPGIVMKVLDAGAAGVICPMVNTRAEAAALVAAMRYPPDGTRSYGPTRASVGGEFDFVKANENTLAIAMIETGQAVENLTEICTTPELDGIYIGPADLTLGVMQGKYLPGMDRKEPEMEEVILRILAAAKDAGIRAGIHTGSPEYAAKAIGWGFDMVTVDGDTKLLATAASDSVAAFRKLTGQASSGGTKPDY